MELRRANDSSTKTVDELCILGVLQKLLSTAGSMVSFLLLILLNMCYEEHDTNRVLRGLSLEL